MSWDSAEYGFEREGDPFGPTRVALAAVVAAVVAALTTTGLFFALGRPLLSRGDAVPPLVGMSLEAAREAAARGGLRLVVTGRAHDWLVPAGSVATQVPLAGSRMPRGGKIGVMVSDGPVPPLDAAAAPDGRPPARRVVSPPAPAAAPTPAPQATPAKAGPQVMVPALVGLPFERVTGQLRKVRLVLGKVRYDTLEGALDASVLRQAPPAGTQVAPGSAVHVVVNTDE